MDSLNSFINHHGPIVWGVLAVFLLLLVFWLATVQARSRRLERQFDDLLGGVSSDNTARMLAEYLGTVRSTAMAVNQMKVEHDRIADLMPTVIRHVGLVRFSPFHDTGGDQSFTLALLDGQQDGVVLTALHSRTDSRLYAKPIEGGGSAYVLTPEEREAMARALNATAVGGSA